MFNRSDRFQRPSKPAGHDAVSALTSQADHNPASASLLPGPKMVDNWKQEPPQPIPPKEAPSRASFVRKGVVKGSGK